MNRETLSDRQQALRIGQLSVSDLTEEALRLAEEKANLNAFITLLPELAREQAAEADSDKHIKPLTGTILAVKDNIALESVPLTCASQILKGYNSLFTSTALKRLIEAGAVIIGKTNHDEFAMGSSNENSSYGLVRNPVDTQRVPGGSSGGSAAAVAAGIATAALGSDTGGSVRQPASFCGVFGLKPTYGRVSRYGLVAFGSSLDQIGVFARTADETARVFEVMAGHDPLDNTSSPVPVPDCSGSIGGSLRGLKIGMPVEYAGEGISPAVLNRVEMAKEYFISQGASVVSCSLPRTKYAIPTYYIISSAEASSNLARYDGVRYGPRPEGEEDVIRRARQIGFGTEVKRRIMLGTFVLSSGYYDAYYLKAQKVRRLIRQDFLDVFKSVDLILGPTAPTTAFKVGEKINDPLEMYLSDIFTVPANLAGIPAISIPFGGDENGLPIGIQLSAPDFREDLLLMAAACFEEALS